MKAILKKAWDNGLYWLFVTGQVRRVSTGDLRRLHKEPSELVIGQEYEVVEKLS